MKLFSHSNLDLESILKDFEDFLKVNHLYTTRKFLLHVKKMIPSCEDAQKYREYLIRKSLSETHINNNLKAIEYYLDFHGISVKLKKLNRRRKLPEILTEKEVKRILYACDNYRDYAIIQTLISTGIRASELCNLNIENVDLENRVIRIVDGKGGRDGIAIMSEKCSKAIQEYLKRRNESLSNALFLNINGKRVIFLIEFAGF
ncbi:MAG: tyrosine-type recombinase/integrase [Candidatus Hydrothermarchaeota archaeon]